jgi:hypothetical protein
MGHIDPAVFERVMAVNVTANWRLIRSLDPLLRQSDAGRAIFITSGAARSVLPYWGAYATSKAALDMLVGTYAAECAHTKVRVNLYNPGPTRTGMRKQAFPGEESRALPPPEAHGEGLIQLALPSCTMNGEWVAGDAACRRPDRSAFRPFLFPFFSRTPFVTSKHAEQVLAAAEDLSIRHAKTACETAREAETCRRSSWSCLASHREIATPLEHRFRSDLFWALAFDLGQDESHAGRSSNAFHRVHLIMTEASRARHESERAWRPTVR